MMGWLDAATEERLLRQAVDEIEAIAGRRLSPNAAAVAAPAAMPAPTAAPAAGAPAAAPADEHPGAVTSPMVGVVYLAPEPGAANFVKVGDPVEEGATLLLIEAMKTFNPVRAPRAGRVTALLVGDSTPVSSADWFGVRMGNPR